jgi:hypothetical protein
VIDPLLV